MGLEEAAEQGSRVTIDHAARAHTRPRAAQWLLALAALAMLLMALAGCGPRPVPVPDETPVAAPAKAPEADARRTFFTFGNASGVIESTIASDETIELRLPFSLGVPASKFRVRIDNVNFLLDERLGDFAVESVYLGASDGDGNFVAPVRLSGPVASRESSVVTEWFDSSAFDLVADEDLLLGVSFSVPKGAAMAAAPGVGWVRTGVPNGALALSENRGSFTMASTLLDMTIEYTLAPEHADTPLVAVIGHSLNAGANLNPNVPHAGENNAWHQLWARQHAGAAASMAAPGSWTPHYAADSPKWERAALVDADVLALWASSSDLVSGTDPQIVREYWLGVIDEAKKRWPGVRIVAFTEPPRGATGEGEQYRNEWNAWLRTMPEPIDALVDADALVQDPSDPSRLLPEADGDSDHFSPHGHQLIADAFAKAIDSLKLR